MRTTGSTHYTQTLVAAGLVGLPLLACASLSNRPAPELSGDYAWVAEATAWKGEGRLQLDRATTRCTGRLASAVGEWPVSRSQFDGSTLHLVLDASAGRWELWLRRVDHRLTERSRSIACAAASRRGSRSSEHPLRAQSPPARLSASWLTIARS